MSPKLRLVWMTPLTVKPPSSSTFHPSAPFHSSKPLPSKSTIASEGGLPFSPGVTTGGSGQMIPARYLCPSKRPPVPTTPTTTTTPSNHFHIAVFSCWCLLLVPAKSWLGVVFPTLERRPTPFVPIH